MISLPASFESASSVCLTPRDLVVRLSVTSRCQLRCAYCLPDKDCGCPSPNSGEELSRTQLVRLVALLNNCFGVRRVRFTGGEPLLRKDLAEIIADVRDLGIPELAITTNAQLLENKVRRLRQVGLQRINVSLDSLHPGVFARITRGGHLDRTLAGIRAAQAAGLGPVKLNMVVLRGVNDSELGDLLRFALNTGCQLRLLELMPIGEAAANFDQEFVPVEEIKARLDKCLFAWRPLPWNGRETSRDFLVRDAGGRETVCGFITPTTQPFCAGCHRVRLTADGFLHGCLARDSRYDLKPLIGLVPETAQQRLRDIMQSAFAHKLGTGFATSVVSMAEVGG